MKPFFDLVDVLIHRGWQKLNHKPARAEDFLGFLIGQNAERANRRRLFARRVIGGDVFGDFAGNQRHLPDVRLAKPQIFDHGERAVFADRAGNVQFAFPVERQVHALFPGVAAHKPAAVGNRGQRRAGTVGADIQSNGILFAFEHAAH